MTMLYCTCFAQVDISAKGGGNLYTVFWRDAIGAKNVRVKVNPGFHAGIAVSIPVYIYNNALIIQPGIFFSQKGFRQQYEDALFGKGVLIVSPRYLEIPINVIYKKNQNSLGAYYGVGGYLAYGLTGGNWSIEYNSGRDAGSIEFVDINNQNQNDDKFNYGKKVDVGVNGLLGYKISHYISLELAAQFGLKNIAPSKAGNMTFEKFTNAGAMLSIVFTLH